MLTIWITHIEFVTFAQKEKGNGKGRGRENKTGIIFPVHKHIVLLYSVPVCVQSIYICTWEFRTRILPQGNRLTQFQLK